MWGEGVVPEGADEELVPVLGLCVLSEGLADPDL